MRSVSQETGLPARPSRHAGGVALVVGAGVLWGTTGTAQALAPAGVDPLTLGAARLLVGGGALLALALWRGTLVGPMRGDWPRIAVAAACMAAYQPLFFAGVARTGVAIGTLVGIGSAPVTAGLLTGLVRREWPGRRWLLATALAVAGCGLLSGVGEGTSRAEPMGIGLAVGAGAAYAAYTVSSKQLLERYRPEGLTAVVFALAALLLSPALAVKERAWLGEPRGIAVVLHLGLVATATAYLLFVRGLARLPAPAATTLSLSEPVTAAILGMAVLGERLTPLGWAGAVAVATGIGVLARGASTRDGEMPPGRRMRSGPMRIESPATPPAPLHEGRGAAP